jgi:hypothetical protein
MASKPIEPTSEPDHQLDHELRHQLDGGERRRLKSRLRRELGRVYGANPWIVAVEHVQAAVAIAEELRNYTDSPILAVGARSGVGPVGDDLPSLSIDLPPAGGMLEELRTAADALAAPPPEIQAAVDRWDPDRQARVIGSFSATAGTVANRPRFGARPPAWRDLEDKLAIEELWAEAGIPVAPSAQVAVGDRPELFDAHQRLATSAGTVWAVDNSEGWHGGGAGTFWVPDRAAAERVASGLAADRLVRIMPFLEGVPCSIHGMVLPEGELDPGGRPTDGTGRSPTVVFRPAEMMTLRDRANHRFVYARAANFWDPAPADRAAMADTARRIGQILDRRVGFGGVFTVDGVMSSQGFMPTEVNTRYGAALKSAMPTLDGEPLDLYLLHLAVVGRELGPIDPARFERWVVTNLDAERAGRGFLELPSGPPDDEERTGEVHRTLDGNLRAESTTGQADGHLTADPLATLRWGSTPGGGRLLVRFGRSVPVGPPTAPLLVAVIQAAADLWGFEPPSLEAAQPVR